MAEHNNFQEVHLRALWAVASPATCRSMGHWSKWPFKFLKFCAFCSCWQLNCKKFTNYPKYMYYQIKTVSELKKFQAGKETFMLWPPHLISSRRHCLWVGDCSVIPQRQTPVTSGQYQYFIGSQKKTFGSDPA